MPHSRALTILIGSAIIAFGFSAWPNWRPAHTSAMVNDQPIYADAPAAGWEDWSWLSTIALDNTAPVHGGAASIAVTHMAADAGFSLRSADAIDATAYTAIRFWAHGGTVARALVLYTQSNDIDGASLTKSITVAPDTWQEISVSLADLGNPAVIKRINLQNNAGPTGSAYFLDEVSLVAATTPADLPDATADRVLGQTLLTTNAAGGNTDQLHGPAGLALAPDGRLYVADYENHRILSWPNAASFTSGLAAEFSVGGLGSGRNQLTHPESVAVDSSGNLFIADTDNQRIVIYTTPVSDGVADVVFGAADPDDCFAANNDATAVDFCYPRGLAFDSAGNLYVADEYHHRIKIYLPPFTDGMSASDVLGQTDLTKGAAGELQGPRGVAIDRADHVFVADSEHNRVVEYDSPLTTDKVSDQELKPLNFPIDLAVDQAGRLYVSELNSHRVLVYADPRNSAATSAPIYGGALANNDCDSTPDPAGIAASATSLHCPLGLAVDTVGNLYVADFDNNRVLAFDAPPPTSTPTPTPTATEGVATDVTLAVDVAAGRKPISPYIYGLNYAKEGFAQEIDLPLRRWGGNLTTRYNWQTGHTNHGSDWFFHNNTAFDPYTGTSETAEQWQAQNRRTGAESLLTLPMIDAVAKDGNPATCGFPVAKYGAQDLADTESGFPNCGNGFQAGTPIIGTAADTSNIVDESFSAAWVTQFKNNAAANGAIRFYALDNEPDIWFETHRDAYPVAWTYNQFRDLSIRYAAAIKAADPAAQLFGPVVHGWVYYVHSPRDGQLGLWAEHPDRAAHGDKWLVEWYLEQMAAYEQQNGVRLLDYLDLHYYPAVDNGAAGIALALAGDGALQAKRLASTRSLWDPTYVDDSWISEAEGPTQIQLIPRMHQWVADNYPNTKLAITEYNWGGLEAINGALAQAEVLGIFGREGVDVAALWNYPEAENNAGQPIRYDIFETLPGAYAFRIYRNYDGQGAKFGETSVQATSSDAEKLSVFAAQRTNDGSLTLVIINKTGDALSANLAISNLAGGDLAGANLAGGGAAQLYRYSEADLNAVQQLPDQPISGAGFTASYPANSITLVRIPASDGTSTATPTATTTAVGTTPTATPTPTATLPAGGGDERVYLPLVEK